jgi:ATP-dependent DNA helicase RecQ
VLRGEPTDKVLKFEHNKLSTFALLRDVKKQQLRIWIDQLIAQGLLSQSSGDYPVLKLNPASWEVMRGQREVSFVASGGASPRTPTGRSDALFSPAERDLFEAMRTLRRRIAVELRVPPFVVFNDVTLRELVRLRPKTPAQMRSIPGIGDRKLVAFGERFLTLILKHEASP